MQNIPKSLIFLSVLLLTLQATAATRVMRTNALPNSEQCRSFVDFTINSKDSLSTSSLVISQNGQRIFEWYDGVVHDRTLHSLWSASKSVLTTLVGVAVQDGKIRLKDPIYKYFPADIRAGLNDPYEANYYKITIGDLLHMASGFKWNEDDDEDNVANLSITRLFYLEGARDLLRYSIRSPLIPEGPGKVWNYSSGNGVILMAILRKVYGADGDTMPWRRLFNRIGMGNAVMERDRVGNFAGSSYVYLTTHGMARLGELYANRGVYNGQQVLPVGWTDLLKNVSPAQLSPYTSKKILKRKGPFSLDFWLNRPIPEKGIPVPYPTIPQDLYFTMGLYGQSILIFPSQKIVIARTGYDRSTDHSDYFIEKFMEKSQACLTNRAELPTTKQREAGTSTDGDISISEIKQKIALFRYIVNQGLLTSIFAKEACSCIYVTGLPLRTCLQRADSRGADLIVDIRPNDYVKGVNVYTNSLGTIVNEMNPGSYAEARVYYENGLPACRLTYAAHEKLVQ